MPRPGLPCPSSAANRPNVFEIIFNLADSQQPLSEISAMTSSHKVQWVRDFLSHKVRSLDICEMTNCDQGTFLSHRQKPLSHSWPLLFLFQPTFCTSGTPLSFSFACLFLEHRSLYLQHGRLAKPPSSSPITSVQGFRLHSGLHSTDWLILLNCSADFSISSDSSSMVRHYFLVCFLRPQSDTSSAF